MADSNHIEIFKQGPEVWNQWRTEHPDIHPDLSEIFVFPMSGEKMSRRMLLKGDTASADPDHPYNFSHTNFYKTNFEAASFPNADMRFCTLYEADLSRAGFNGANFEGSMLRKAYCAYTNFSDASLIDCVFNNASFIHVDFSGARLEGCNVYGVSVWDAIVDENTIQQELFLHRDNFSRSSLQERVDAGTEAMPPMVDDIALAQFIYFITQNDGFGQALRQLNTTSVLLLGKFKDGGLQLLRKMAGLLRSKGYNPIIFDFEPAAHTNLIENVTAIAGISKIVMANLEGSSVPAELARITASFHKPIIAWVDDARHDQVYAMFSDVLARDNAFYFTYNSDETLQTQTVKYLEAAETYLMELSKHRSVANLKMKQGRVDP